MSSDDIDCMNGTTVIIGYGEYAKLKNDLAVCEADGERLVELSKANVRRLEEARADLAAAREALRFALDRMKQDGYLPADPLYARIDALVKGDDR